MDTEGVDGASHPALMMFSQQSGRMVSVAEVKMLNSAVELQGDTVLGDVGHREW